MNISVCMATYNGEKYVARQLASILSQLSTDDEIIVSDDSSTDMTVQIIESFQDSRIKILRGNKFYSPTLNFENALKHAGNEYIFLSDQDDIWESNKVETMSNLLKSFDLVLSDCKIVDNKGKVIYNSYFEYMKASKGLIRNMYKSPYMGCCMAFNKKILNIALPIPKNITLHDWWIGMIAEVHGKVYFCPEKLIQYVRHGANASNTGFKSKNSLKTKFMMRLNLSINLVKTLF